MAVVDNAQAVWIEMLVAAIVRVAVEALAASVIIPAPHIGLPGTSLVSHLPKV